MNKRIAPQEGAFNKSLKYNKWNNYVFWTSFFITIAFQLFSKVLEKVPYIDAIKICISIIFLVSIFTLDALINSYTDKAEKIRRKTIIDNSYGKAYCDTESHNYYDNDEIQLGLYKLLINLFENSFYTKNILERMLEKVYLKTFVYLILLIIFAVIGFSNCSAVAISIVQLFLSKKVVIKAIGIKRFSHSVNEVYDDITKLFNNPTFNSNNIQKFESDIIKQLILYETAISANRVQLSDKIFNENNQKLLEEWKKIKQRYNIQ